MKRSGEQKRANGWAWPSNSRRAHFYADGRSLCGKWLIFGGALQKADFGPDNNCRPCVRKLERKQSKGRQ